jgi:hypothetical protein
MRTRRILVSLAVCLVSTGCGDDTVTRPSPISAPPAVVAPPPPPSTAITVRIALTDVVTGADLGSETREVARLPALVAITRPGYLPREALVHTAAPSVSLVSESGFDLEFYRQFARDSLRFPGLRQLVVLQESPSFYMEVGGEKGFSEELSTKLERVARRIVPDLTAGRLQVARWETGPTPRGPREGWITVERRDQESICGSALPGAVAGQIWLSSVQPGCRIESTFAHEIGHALGFFHVERPGSMMNNPSQGDAPSEFERRHSAIAYSRPRGNLDIDRDPQAPSAAVTPLRAID